MSHSQQIIQAVSAWEGITVHPHRFGGTQFNLGKVEIGHIHGSHMADIPFTVPLRAALVSAGETDPHHLLPQTGWTSFYLRQEKDAAQVVKLLRLSYLQKRLSRAKGAERTQLEDALTALDVDERVKALLVNKVR